MKSPPNKIVSKQRHLLLRANPLLYVFILFSCYGLFLISLLSFLPRPSRADTSLINNGFDTCGLIKVSLSQTPNCNVLSSFNGNSGSCKNPTNGATNANIGDQTLLVTLKSNNGALHQVTYNTANNFCTNGYLNTSGNFCNCVSNPLYTNQTVVVPATGSVPITITRSPTTGSNCGSYQFDFSIQSIDGNTNCTMGNGSSAVGASLTCETGITCTAAPTPTPTPPPNCTTTPINCSACSAPANTCSNGNGTQTCTLSQTQTCTQVVTTRSCTLNNCTNGNICVNQTCQPPTYTISGNVFNDLNKNGTIDAGENNYPATPPITATKGTVTTNANGTYTISNIPAGAITVRYTTPPANYYMTSPLNGPPPSFSVTVGTAGCTVNSAPGASCTAGNITNLNFGITNTHPWFQAGCGDMRNDNGVSDTVPTGQSIFSTDASCNNPGIVFTGNTNANLGSGQATQIVGGVSHPEILASTLLDTSYTSLLAKAQSADIIPTNLATICTLSNCSLPTNLPHGIYHANGNVNVNAFTFPANRNYVFLINGNLTLNGTITVPIGSTALFSTTNDIIVSPTIGKPANNPAPSLEGWYIAGHSFISNSQGNCNDLRLNIRGSLTVNAMKRGGSFLNNRDLCGSDTNNPTISVIQRLDMILNAPSFIQRQQTISQEMTP